MKAIFFLLFIGLLSITASVAQADTLEELQKDYALFERYIVNDIVSWEEEFQDFNQGIYQNILNNHQKLDEIDIFIAKEFARVAQSLLKQIIKELNRVKFISESWIFLNEKLITICYLQKYNLELLLNLPLSEEDYNILKKSRTLMKDLQIKWEDELQQLKEKSSY